MNYETVSFSTTQVQINKNDKQAILQLDKSGNQRACSVTCRNTSSGEKFTVIFDFDDTKKVLIVPLCNSREFDKISVDIIFVTGTRVRRGKNKQKAVLEFQKHEYKKLEADSKQSDKNDKIILLSAEHIQNDKKFQVAIKKIGHETACSIILKSEN